MFPLKEIEDKVLEFSETEDKAGLDEYAKSFDVKLDRRKSFDNMVESFAKELGKLPKETFSKPSTEQEPEQDDKPNSEDTGVDEQSETQTDEESESDGDLDTADKQTEQKSEQPEPEPVEESRLEISNEFRPSFDLTFKDSRYGGEYANVGYWVIDELQKNRVIERDWSQESIDECRHRNEIQTILYYIKKNGSCLVRESRNSKFYRIYENGAKVAG